MKAIYCKDDIRQVEVFTADELRADLEKVHRRAVKPESITVGEFTEPLAIPDVEVQFTIGNSAVSSGKVVFKLYNIGDQDDRAFDCDIHSHNNDNWGLRQTQSAINVAVEEFYSLGYHTQFGRLIGE